MPVSLAGTIQSRSAAIPGRSKVGSTKAFDSNARIGVTMWCAGSQTDQSFVKTNAPGVSLVAAPGDGRISV